MYVKKIANVLEFSGNDFYHLCDLLNITPNDLNNALNHENYEYIMRTRSVDELMLDIGKLVITN